MKSGKGGKAAKKPLPKMGAAATKKVVTALKPFAFSGIMGGKKS